MKGMKGKGKKGMMMAMMMKGKGKGKMGKGGKKGYGRHFDVRQERQLYRGEYKNFNDKMAQGGQFLSAERRESVWSMGVISDPAEPDSDDE